LALKAQGFDRPRPRAVTARHITAVADRLGVIQIDSVNVLARSHFVPFFSRLGPFDNGLVDQAMFKPPRRLVETWAHEASLVRPEVYHLLQWRRDQPEQFSWGRMQQVVAENPNFVEVVYDHVAAQGPLTGRQVQAELAHLSPPPAKDKWGWNWSQAKDALEWLFFVGRLASAGRTASFERRYDLASRVVPAPAGLLPPEAVRLAGPEPAHHAGPEPARRAGPKPVRQMSRESARLAQLELTHQSPPRPAHQAQPAACARDNHFDQITALTEIAARALGVATAATLRDYFRLPRAASAAAIGRLVDQGSLEPVTITGPNVAAYVPAGARVPRSLNACALLTPFDPLLFDRARLAWLFDMHFRLEFYLPKAKRQFGYYVMPFLLGDRLVARVDVKANRPGGALEVKGAFLEPGANAGEVASALAVELGELARWLALGRIDLEDGARGDLVTVLSKQLDA